MQTTQIQAIDAAMWRDGHATDIGYENAIFDCYLFALLRRVYAATLKIRINIEHFYW